MTEPRAVMLLAARSPHPGPDGSALRAFHLAREVASTRPCHLVTCSTPDPWDDELIRTGIFRTITRLRLPSGPPAATRHVRWSDRAYWRRSHPAGFRRVRHQLERLIAELDVGVVVAADLWLAEFVLALDGVGRVVDDCDCVWLTLTRQLRLATDLSPGSRVALWLHAWRVRGLESGLTARADLVTTVAPMDASVLRRLSRRRPEAVRVLPNGVAPALLEPVPPAPERPAAIAFWGNLDFGPNRDAVWHFYRQIYLPHLRGTGIQCCFIGPNPDPQLVQAVQDDPQVTVTGLVDDLFSLVRGFPVVINPMVSGSGIKNKMLEAFALGRAVVSSTLGMEGIAAVPGQHYIAADTPPAFARGIRELLDDPARRSEMGQRARALVLERYTWNRIGEEWRGLLEEIFRRRAGAV